MDYARLLPWLAWTLLTYACVDIAGKRNRSPFRPADAAAAASTEAAAGTDSKWTESAVQHYIDDLVYQGIKAPQVLMVLDPNGVMCWEDVGIDEFTNATLLPWLHSQHDALTLSNYDPSGKTLQASSSLLCKGTLHVRAQLMQPVWTAFFAAGQSSAAAVLSNSNDSDTALALGKRPIADAPPLAVWKCSCHICLLVLPQ